MKRTRKRKVTQTMKRVRKKAQTMKRATKMTTTTTTTTKRVKQRQQKYRMRVQKKNRKQQKKKEGVEGVEGCMVVKQESESSGDRKDSNSRMRFWILHIFEMLRDRKKSVEQRQSRLLKQA